MADIDIEAPGADEADLKAALRDLVGAAIIVGGTGAAASHTGNTNETVLGTVSIPGGSMGPNGFIRLSGALWSFTNSANTKRLRARLGGIGGTVVFDTGAVNTSQATFTEPPRLIFNRGSLSSQVCRAGPSAGAAASTAAVITASLDTSVALDLVLTAQLGNAGETITLESFLVETGYIG